MKKSIKCTRFHTLEAIINKITKNTTKPIRSVLCLKVVKFYSKSIVCRICQNMTIDEKAPGKEKNCRQMNLLRAKI